MAEDENQSFFFQREIYSFHNYDQFAQENMINHNNLHPNMTNNSNNNNNNNNVNNNNENNNNNTINNNNYEIAQHLHQENPQQYKIENKMDQQMQLEEDEMIDQNQNQQQQQYPLNQSQQQPSLSDSHFNILHQSNNLQQSLNNNNNSSLIFSQPQQQQQQQSAQQQQQQLQQQSSQIIQQQLLLQQSQSSHDKMDNNNMNRFQNKYLKSEEAGRNYPLLANILDESQQNIKLNEFYIQNKVLQGLNCFMLLDNEMPRHTASANNFCDDPNFFLGHIFDEKNKNTIISDVKNDTIQNNHHLKNSYQSPQQNPIITNQKSNNLLSDNPPLQLNMSSQINSQQQQQQQQQQQFNRNEMNQIQSDIHNEQRQNNKTQHKQHQLNNSHKVLHSIPSFHQQENDDQQFLRDFISGYLQQNTPQTYMNEQLQSEQQQQYQNNNNNNNHGNNNNANQNHNNNHHPHNNNIHNNHDGQIKGPSKNAFQRSSTSFLDKVTFAVDDFLDKQDPNEFPELSSGEDFLMTNLRNYIALEFSYNQESSYFQKYLNSSYQIFLQRIKLLIDQKRMDSKTLLPFVCRFSIEMAEKLLHFIYKCDDKFTMKLFREQSYFSKENNNHSIKKEYINNGSTSPTTYGSQHSQKFDSSIIDDDISSIFKTVDSHNISPIQPPQNQQSTYPKNNYMMHNNQPGSLQLNQGYNSFGMQQNNVNLHNSIQNQQQQQQSNNNSNNLSSSQHQQSIIQSQNILQSQSLHQSQQIQQHQQHQQQQQFSSQSLSQSQQLQQQQQSQLQQQQQLLQQQCYQQPQQQMQQQNINQNNIVNNDIEEEDDEDQLPFPVQKSSLFDIGKAQRKQWKKSEITELMLKYREYQQKIPPQIMDELTKKFNRSVQSIQSKIQKLRKNHNMQIQDMMSDYSQNYTGLSYSQNSSIQNSNSIRNNIDNSNRNYQCNPNNPGMMMMPQLNQNQNQSNMMKIESKLKNCLFELENQRGTKNEILKKMKERFYSIGGQSTAWETSAKQLLSSQSFQRRKGVFQLKEDVQISNLDATDSSSYKQKLIYTLSLLPDRKGTLEDIVSLYLKKFGNEADHRKIKENIQKILNQYSDCFDKSQSKTTYYLTPQEIQLISQEIQSQNNINNNNYNQNTTNNNTTTSYENSMSLQNHLQSRCSRSSIATHASEGNGHPYSSSEDDLIYTNNPMIPIASLSNQHSDNLCVPAYDNNNASQATQNNNNNNNSHSSCQLSISQEDVQKDESLPIMRTSRKIKKDYRNLSLASKYEIQQENEIQSSASKKKKVNNSASKQKKKKANENDLKQQPSLELQVSIEMQEQQSQQQQQQQNVNNKQSNNQSAQQASPKTKQFKNQIIQQFQKCKNKLPAKLLQFLQKQPQLNLNTVQKVSIRLPKNEEYSESINNIQEVLEEQEQLIKELVGAQSNQSLHDFLSKQSRSKKEQLALSQYYAKQKQEQEAKGNIELLKQNLQYKINPQFIKSELKKEMKLNKQQSKNSINGKLSPTSGSRINCFSQSSSQQQVLPFNHQFDNKSFEIEKDIENNKNNQEIMISPQLNSANYKDNDQKEINLNIIQIKNQQSSGNQNSQNSSKKSIQKKTTSKMNEDNEIIDVQSKENNSQKNIQIPSSSLKSTQPELQKKNSTNNNTSNTTNNNSQQNTASSTPTTQNIVTRHQIQQTIQGQTSNNESYQPTMHPMNHPHYIYGNNGVYHPQRYPLKQHPSDANYYMYNNHHSQQQHHLHSQQQNGYNNIPQPMSQYHQQQQQHQRYWDKQQLIYYNQYQSTTGNETANNNLTTPISSQITTATTVSNQLPFNSNESTLTEPNSSSLYQSGENQENIIYQNSSIPPHHHPYYRHNSNQNYPVYLSHHSNNNSYPLSSSSQISSEYNNNNNNMMMKKDSQILNNSTRINRNPHSQYYSSHYPIPDLSNNQINNDLNETNNNSNVPVIDNLGYPVKNYDKESMPMNQEMNEKRDDFFNDLNDVYEDSLSDFNLNANIRSKKQAFKSGIFEMDSNQEQFCSNLMDF